MPRFVIALLLVLLARPASAETRLVLLGTGTPNPDPERSGPAVAVIVDDRAYLVDAGPGIVRRAAAAAERHDIAALQPPGLSRLFLTHLHSDHTTGLPDLLLTPWTLERTDPLQVVGPPGTDEMMGHLSRAYGEDVRNRLYGLEPANTTGYRTVVTESTGGRVYEDDKVHVDAIPVVHGSWPVAFAYRFVTPDKVIVISGDTRPCTAITEAARGCDILVHEVYSQVAWERRTEDWQRYHAAGHTSTTELAELANEARPKLLVLYHQLYWGSSDEELLAEITAHYDGEVVSGADLDVFD